MKWKYSPWNKRDTGLIQLIPEALKFHAVHRRCTSVCDRNVRRTGNVNICRRSKDQRRAINNFDRASATARCLRLRRNNICRSCSNIFPRARFYFHRRSSHPAFIMEQAVKRTPPSTLSAFNPLLFLPSTHSRPHDGSNYPFEYVLFERSVEKLFWSTWSRNGRQRLTQAIMKTILYILLLIIFFF